jgi:tetratricopeptide (TPR) repeat protein
VSAPRARVTLIAPGRIARDTGSAYLTGLRRFVAAVLWIRIDPLMHEYYAGQALDKMLFMVPSLSAVIWLDPRLEAASYVLPWILVKNGRVHDALAVADRGVAENPHSGILLAGYAQILELYGDQIDKAADEAELALDPATTWPSDADQWSSLRVAEAILYKAGRVDAAKRAGVLLDRLAAAHGGAAALQDSGQDDHDHNNDGKPDH